MWAGVAAPTLVGRWALFASGIWSADAPTPTLLVAACADSAAFFTLSMKPITASLPLRLLPARATAGHPQAIDRRSSRVGRPRRARRAAQPLRQAVDRSRARRS